MKLLDTTFLIGYERGQEVIGAYLKRNEDREFVTSTICLKELAVGKHLVGSPTRADLTANYGWLRIVPFTLDYAYEAGALEAALHDDPGVNRDGIDSLSADALIAGTARSLGATVVTRNVSDFERFEGIAVESY
ncbi:type II toxin-antitoxin system VapC family toxin [Natronorarus salvus]|uniref:type II toxin-antitoxin system VapC family toxin n=1 Tax=Natronorarus salvus TaxID=3117733 RepID=UPI002F26269E